MRIGLTQRVFYHKGQAYDSTDQNWYSYLQHHRLSVVPNSTKLDFEALADYLDALIITGGDDSALRRTTELSLASQMMMRRKPIIGICHGCFLLTETLGGEIGDCVTHNGTSHLVYHFGDRHQVNSHHTLQIKQPHSNATVVAVDEEGFCEAWIDENIAGVVWHPELMSEPWIPDEIEDLLKERM